MATKTVQIAIDATYKGAAAFKKAEADVKGLESGASKAGSGLKSAFATMGVAVGAAGAAFGALAMAAKGAWDTFQAGAVLLDARGDFEDLTAAIGTTSDAMLGKLKSATGGLVSDAQLIADASNMMATGLGLSEQQIVAFSGAAAQLDWNLETLTDTLNTGSTRGLKEMGLSIDFVKTRMAELEAQGIATDEAFRMAILEAADKKIEAVGKKSEEAAGQVQILQVQVENVDNAFKEAFSESLVAQMQKMAGATQAMGPGLESAAGGAGALAGSFASIMATGLLTNPTFLQLMKMGFNIQADNLPTLEMAELAEMTAVYEKNARKAADAQRELNASMDADTAQGYTNRQAGRIAELTEKYREETNEVNEILWASAEEAEAAQQEMADAANQAAEEAAQAWEEYAGRVSSAFGEAITSLQDIEAPDLFSEDSAANMEAVNTAIYNAGVSAGGTAGQISGLGVALGQFSPQMAEAALKAALFSGALEILSKEWKVGAIDTETFISSVNQVVADLESNTVVELQTKAATGGSFQEPVKVPVQPEWAGGDPIGPGEIAPIRVPVTIADDALSTAITAQSAHGCIDGRQGVVYVKRRFDG